MVVILREQAFFLKGYNDFVEELVENKQNACRGCQVPHLLKLAARVYSRLKPFDKEMLISTEEYDELETEQVQRIRKFYRERLEQLKILKQSAEDRASLGDGCVQAKKVWRFGLAIRKDFDKLMKQFFQEWIQENLTHRYR